MSKAQELQRAKKEHYFKLQMKEEMEKLGLSLRKQMIVTDLLLYAYKKGVNICNTDG